MRKYHSRFIPISALILGLLSGCAPTPTPMPATLTPTPTVTPLPTPTPYPTITPVPSATPIPPTPTVLPPEKVSEYINGAKVVFVDNFKNPPAEGWVYSTGIIRNSGLEVLGNNWNGPFRENGFMENQGVIVDFSFSKDSVFEMFFNVGDFRTSSYKRFGYYIEYRIPRVNIWSGPVFLGGAQIPGNLNLKPDTMYTVMMILLPNGAFRCVIWDPQEPSKTLRYRAEIGKTWSEQHWLFKIGAKHGSITVNNYREITFDSLR